MQSRDKEKKKANRDINGAISRAQAERPHRAADTFGFLHRIEKLWEYSQAHRSAPVYDASARLSDGNDACKCRTRIFSRLCASACAFSVPTIS